MIHLNNNDIFERLYNELEDVIREKYHLPETGSAVYFYESKVSGEASKHFRLVRELRNYIVHDKRIDMFDAFSITDESISFVRKAIDQLKKPMRAIDICILKSQILFARIETPVIPLMKSMLERNISHVPVLDGQGILFGVYSGSTLLVSLTENPKSIFDQQTTISLFKPYLPINQHVGERYWFVNKVTPLDEIIDLFGHTTKDGKKLKMLFMTENGKQTEKILGIITPWNVFERDIISAT